MKLKLADYAMVALVLFYLVKWVDLGGLVAPTSYEGMQAVTIVESMTETNVDVLNNLAELGGMAAARGMTYRQYDPDQDAAKNLLPLTNTEPPLLLIRDGDKIVAVKQLPTDLNEALGPVTDE